MYGCRYIFTKELKKTTSKKSKLELWSIILVKDNSMNLKSKKTKILSKNIGTTTAQQKC